tara:strand:- start:1200 stop:1379 length:180 start_codon:yes stop_codon:yes gene_type:complete
MAEKKRNLITIIPAFLLMGTAIGIQVGAILKYAAVGFVVGVLIYLFLSYRNKIINKQNK